MTEENTLKNDVLKVYEVGYLLLSNIEDTKTQEESLKIRDIIEKNKGQFLSEGTPKMTNLTYPMVKSILGKKQKFDNAYFGWIKFESNSINEVKKSLDSMEKILRYLVIITTKDSIITSSSNNVKKGKFSFEEEKQEKSEELEKQEKQEKSEEKEKSSKLLDDNQNDEVEEGVKDEDKVDAEQKADKEKKESSKKLDETIDDLVIE